MAFANRPNLVFVEGRVAPIANAHCIESLGYNLVVADFEQLVDA